jgi:isopentenyl diphosphate isomerase/L-lactate dehydrogenase-like FMN-dependent dehydrogenase
VGDRLEVYVDGGVRKGADVLKALALGARATFVGRPIFWGLSVGGEAGVSHCLEILRSELNVAMGLCGVTDVKQVDRSVAQDPAANTTSVVGDLERLARLLDQGYLTREEFETQKSRLLG